MMIIFTLTRYMNSIDTLIKYFQISITLKKRIIGRDINHHNNWCKNIQYN